MRTTKTSLIGGRVLCLLLLCPASSLAGPIALIDMGRANNPTGTVGEVTYNDLSISSGSGGGPVSIVLNGGAATTSPAPMVDTGNTPTGWTISLEVIVNISNGQWGNNGGTVVPPYPASLNSIASTALQDNLYLNRNERGRITLAGLDDGKNYIIRLYANETNNDGNASMSFIPVSGSGAGFVTTNIQARDNETDVLEWNEVAPDGGVIAFEIQSAREGWLNFMSIEDPSGPAGFPLTITPNTATPGHYDFEWDSRDNMVYDLVSSTDLSTAPEIWPVWQGNENITGTAPENMLPDIPGGGDPTRFFAVIEKDPPPLFAEDFESSDGGFTVVDHSAGGAGSIWAHGDPDSSGEGGAVTTGNGGSTKCWGTDIGNPGVYATGTDTSLISPVIDLTSVPDAVLAFAQAIDILGGDSLVVNIIDDDLSGGISVLQAAIHTSTPDLDLGAADWEEVSDIPITGGEPVRIEWRFAGINDGSYLGAYIDVVTVSPAAP